MRKILAIIGLLVLLAVLNTLFPFLRGGPSGGESKEKRPDIEWALDAPSSPVRFDEAEAFRPLIALTAADEPANALTQAIRRGDIETVKGMLAGNPGLVRREKQRLPPLFEAILTDNAKMVQIFIDAGADIHMAYRIDGRKIHSPLSHAILHNKRKSLFLLLESGADVNRLTCDEEARCGNALSMAAMTGDSSLVRDMIVGRSLPEHVVNLQPMYPQYASVLSIIGKRARILPPLHVAAVLGFPKVAETLIALGADVNAEDAVFRTADRYAKGENGAPIRALIEAERKRAKRFITAIESRDLERVAAMIAAGANPDVGASPRGSAPLLAAIDAGNSAIVKILLSANADPGRRVRRPSPDRSPLKAALDRRDLEIIRLLFAAGGNPNERVAEKMPLFAEAVLSDDTDIVQAFLNAGASLTTRYKTHDGQIHNILSYAVSRNKLRSAVLLARHGANPDWLTCTAEQICGNVLTLAVLSGNALLVEDLIAEGRMSQDTVNMMRLIDPVRGLEAIVIRSGNQSSPAFPQLQGKTREREGQQLLSPLQAAIRTGHKQIVEIIQEYGAPDASLNSGSTQIVE